MGVATGISDPAEGKRSWEVVMLVVFFSFLNYAFVVISFLKNNFIYFIFGSAGPLLLHRIFSSCGEQGLLSS